MTIFSELAKVLILFYVLNGILQSIPAFSTNSPLASLVPVAWCVGIGMILEGIADYRRRVSDLELNTQVLTRYDICTGTKSDMAAADLVVGDVIYL